VRRALGRGMAWMAADAWSGEDFKTLRGTGRPREGAALDDARTSGCAAVRTTKRPTRGRTTSRRGAAVSNLFQPRRLLT
jgi:hypothetical protein